MGRKIKYIPGYRIGSLTVLSVDRTTNKVLLLCDCGNGVEYRLSHLSMGNKIDCGCLGSKSWIYFISLTGQELGLDFNFVKIGRTADGDINNRLSVTRTHTPFLAKVINQVLGPPWVEHWMHNYFSHLRLYHDREWFRYSEEMLTIRSPTDC